MIGILYPDEIESLLARQQIGRLACSVNDRPYVVPINYVYDGGYVYGYSMVGRKIEVMREQPLVCFEIDEIIEPSGWRSVIAEGIYEEITDERQRKAAAARLNGSGVGLVPRTLEVSRPIVFFRIRLTEKSGRFERRDA